MHAKEKHKEGPLNRRVSKEQDAFILQISDYLRSFQSIKMKAFSHLMKDLVKQAPNAFIGSVVEIGSYRVRVENVIGEGGYATIYKVRDLGTGISYALKVVRIQGNSELLEGIRHEMEIMTKLKGHPNILRLHASQFLHNNQEAHLLLDYCHISLKAYMTAAHSQGAATVLANEHLVIDIALAVAEALTFMHSQQPPYAHRDIKPENVLLHVHDREGGNVKRWVLCDFGSCSTLNGVLKTTSEISHEEEVVRKTTTPAYRAPELWDLYSGDRIDGKVDLWALGCMLYWMIYGKMAFDGDSALAAVGGKFELPPGKEPLPSPLLTKLLRDLLHVSPSNRPSAAQVVERLRAIKGGGSQGVSTTTSPRGVSPSSSSSASHLSSLPPRPGQPPLSPRRMQQLQSETWDAQFDDVPSSHSTPPAQRPHHHRSSQSAGGSLDSIDLLSAAIPVPPRMRGSSSLGTDVADSVAVQSGALTPSPLEPREELLENLAEENARLVHKMIALEARVVEQEKRIAEQDALIAELRGVRPVSPSIPTSIPANNNNNDKNEDPFAVASGLSDLFSTASVGDATKFNDPFSS